MSRTDIVSKLYRHEFGKLVACLSQRVGIQHLSLVEDVVQMAIEQALIKWENETPPDNPSAWLYQTAFRFFLSDIRTNKRKQALNTQHNDSLDTDFAVFEEPPLQGEFNDALLRMLFVTCEDKLAVESQLVFTLKSLCGFSIPAIANRLFISEANAYKRYNRAKTYLRQQNNKQLALNSKSIAQRLPAVLRILYVVFTEGYLSSHEINAIRLDLCNEALRLATLLDKSAWGKLPECKALLALMHFNIARIDARYNAQGLVLLEYQDRGRWDQAQILLGLNYLQLSASGEHLSRYHLEASIAAEHCMAPSFDATPWQSIVASYTMLEHVSPSPMNTLNKAIAIAEWKGTKAALAVIESAHLPHWLACSYHWYAVLADLQYRDGQLEEAAQNGHAAIEKASSKHIKALLRKRFAQY